MRKLCIGSLAAAALLFSFGGIAQAASFKFQYAAKFVCGFDPPPAFLRVAPGQYATSVLIHNPQRKSVTIRKKVALTFPAAPPFAHFEQAPGAVSEFIEDTLLSDEALQVDCQEIGPLGGSSFFPGGIPAVPPVPPYIQGFVIIESERSVDVTTIVSVADLGGGPVGPARSLDVQQVRERKIRDDDD